MDHENCQCAVCAELITPGTLKVFIDTMIKKNGFAIAPVIDPGNPTFVPFHYTIGLTEIHKSPEIIIIGHFNSTLINALISKIVEQIRTNPAVLDTEEINNISQIKLDDGNMKYVSLGCRIAKDRFKEMCCGRLIDRYGEDAFRLRQIILPDEKGKLPWHKDFDTHWSKCQARQISLYDPTFHIVPTKECQKCYVRDIDLSKCSGCMKVRYCSIVCQKEDWKGHKLICKK